MIRHVSTFHVAVLIGCAPLVAAAQDIPKEFPADAKAIADDDLKARIAGRSFEIPTVKEGSMQVEYKDNGWANFTWPAKQYNDTGKWYVKAGQSCLELNKQRGSPPACSEVREAAGRLYLKRSSNGEVVAMNPK